MRFPGQTEYSISHPQNTLPMNIFVQELAEGDLGELEHHEYKLVVEDNVGEGVHIHFRNVRLEMPIEDYIMFADRVEKAAEDFEYGNC